ncbi:MAG: response regulator [Candidatus Omnitrophota bacterium]|jgi:response regulator RpfG family c-di-GMP phosphodiesterase|nr:MAG: response regulator [Candidatus Omnitrophota bacterium]
MTNYLPVPKPVEASGSEPEIFHGKKILVIDDDKTICVLICEYLGKLGMDCLWTSVPRTAVEWIQEKEFDVILTDIYMPEISGHDILSLALAQLPHTPVILMTGNPSLHNTIEAIRLGAYDYLTKPFKMNVVEMTLGRALHYRKLVMENLAYQNHLEIQVQERTRELSDFLFHAVQSLSLALEARDPYTQGHGYRVGELVVKLAGELGVAEEEHQALRLASQLHDIGKIGIPDSILLKPGKLTTTEYDLMKDHVFIGYHILSPIPSLKEVSRYVYEHHERMDGKGYPRGLAGSDIHVNSRILMVSEVYDALATERTYKPAWPLRKIRDYFLEQAGTAYDPDVVNALLSLLDKEGEEILKLFQGGFS